MESPIACKEGIELLGQLDLIEFALMAAVSGDAGGPLTSSPTTRRNIAIVLRSVAVDLGIIADSIDPLADHSPKEPDSAEDTTSPTEPGA